jgi:hypothetical protein
VKKGWRIFTLIFFGFALGIFAFNSYLQYQTKVNDREIKRLNQEIQQLEQRHHYRLRTV